MPKYDRDGIVKTVNKKTTTKYDGKVFDRYLEHCYNGGSTPEFCRNERICRDTFDAWIEKYDTAKIVKKTAKYWAEGWWLKEAKDNLVIHNEHQCGTTKFDTNLYKYYTGGRFGHTSDKELTDRVSALEEKQASHSQNVPTSAYAEEAECEDDIKTE